MSSSARKPLAPLTLIFILVNALFLAFRSKLEAAGFSANVLVAGNTFLFLITLASYFLAVKGLKHKNPNAFVRGVYGSVMLKMFASIIAAFIYIAIYQKNLNKPAIFGLMALYLVYTFVEVSALTKQLRSRNDAPAA